MNDLAQAKIVMRRDLRKRRSALSPLLRAEETAATCAALVRLILTSDNACDVRRVTCDVERPPHTVTALASYAAMPDELDIADFHQACWKSGIIVFLPRVVAPGLLSWHALRNPADAALLKPGAYGIREPDPTTLPAEDLPAGIPLLVPGLAFAGDGRRLGQGGGFYDRLIGKASRWAIGVGFSCQLVEDLPVEAHDARVATLVLAGRVLPGNFHSVT